MREGMIENMTDVSIQYLKCPLSNSDPRNTPLCVQYFEGYRKRVAVLQLNCLGNLRRQIRIWAEYRSCW